MSKHDELVERLKGVLAEDVGDESWADDLPEADELPDDEDDTVAEIGPKRPLDASSRPSEQNVCRRTCVPWVRALTPQVRLRPSGTSSG